MPLVLHDELPNGLWTHDSGGEHSVKHMGDLADVHQLRQDNGETLPELDIETCMSANGLVVVRHLLKDNSAGEIAGYAIADRLSDPKSIRLEELYVNPDIRGKGLGGYIVGRVITLSPWVFPTSNMAIHKIPLDLHTPNATYKLPGDHTMIKAPSHQDELHEQSLDEFKSIIASGQMSLILDVTGPSFYCERTLYRNGEIIADLDIEQHRGKNPVLTASNILNDRKL